VSRTGQRLRKRKEEGKQPGMESGRRGKGTRKEDINRKRTGNQEERGKKSGRREKSGR
jgi:hypothetical protein